MTVSRRSVNSLYQQPWTDDCTYVHIIHREKQIKKLNKCHVGVCESLLSLCHYDIPSQCTVLFWWRGFRDEFCVSTWRSWRPVSNLGFSNFIVENILCCSRGIILTDSVLREIRFLFHVVTALFSGKILICVVCFWNLMKGDCVHWSLCTT